MYTAYHYDYYHHAGTRGPAASAPCRGRRAPPACWRPGDSLSLSLSLSQLLVIVIVIVIVIS